MATRLITNIKLLVNAEEQLQLLRGRALAVLPCIEKAWLIIEDGIIAGYGKMEAIGDTLHKHADKIDASGQFVLPCWCDSHTHLVFAASREEEFIDKMHCSEFRKLFPLVWVRQCSYRKSKMRYLSRCRRA